jgi:hypothetical protein
MGRWGGHRAGAPLGVRRHRPPFAALSKHRNTRRIHSDLRPRHPAIQTDLHHIAMKGGTFVTKLKILLDMLTEGLRPRPDVQAHEVGGLQQTLVQQVGA